MSRFLDRVIPTTVLVGLVLLSLNNLVLSQCLVNGQITNPPGLWEVRVYDASNNRILANKGVVITVSYTSITVVVDEYRYPEGGFVSGGYQGRSSYNTGSNTQVLSYDSESLWIWPSLDLSDITYKYTPWLTTQVDVVRKRAIAAAQAHIRVTARNYQPEELDVYWPTDNPEVDVRLVPQQFNVNMSGGLNVNGNSNPSPQPTDRSLDVYSVDEIAEKLGVPKDEIIKLIKTKQLKAKKIGTTYFIRKQDFEDFMKR